ncbi:chromate transporter-domain-containing protein [Chaetomium fimeti]|uniref:Chromate transporter-domain-containing protein n=1 Tax=Chaetomium fimeti TaxID=1854472 RepID=A0AAE0LSZ3_9PEZI|nr:chromate transporter-domain-containing protein [Chaetomium fimeti]
MGIKQRCSPSAWAWDAVSNWNVTPRLWNTARETWYLGFTSFGGPPVHFKIFHDKFVTKLQWIDEQVYQELFSVCQAFSGPGSTKMLYCINLMHDGFLPAVLGFLFWSLPAALGMFGLAIGISNIGETLPRAVYALLSRDCWFFGAAAGLLYNALWYFPLLMLGAGIIAVVYDFRWLHGPVKWAVGLPRRARGSNRKNREAEAEAAQEESEIELSQQPQHASEQTPSRAPSTTSARQRVLANTDDDTPATGHTDNNDGTRGNTVSDEARTVPSTHDLQTQADTPTTMGWKAGLSLILLFLASFVVIMVLRSTLPQPPLLYRLFSNLYLAGTIIFGGGPVVIPLLREYIVAEGWVSTRDFLIGLAIIQSLPGPNFNFAVYLGALTAANAGHPPAAGAVLGYLAIYLPGLATVHGTVGVWGKVRGVNAAAVGLIYTAVYRLWQIGWIDEGFERGASLAEDPWWVVVTASSYVGGCWFGVSPPVACVAGAVLGLLRFAVVG